VSYTPSEQFPELVETMKRAAGALREAEIPFILGGGMAAWARGGPPTDHDVDLFLRQDDAERGLAALTDAGLRPERPPEGWLLKAWDGDVLVDLIFHPAGGPVDDGWFRRATATEVVAQPLLVASIDDVLATKLLAMSEQAPDYRPVLEIARALREQVDWDGLRTRVAGAPFGAAFLTLAERLEIAPGPAGGDGLPGRGVGKAENGRMHPTRGERMATMTKPRELFLHELGDIYYAESQIVKKLPKMIDEASDRELAQGLEKHLGETKQQISNLERVFSELGERAKGERCPGIEGIAEEHDLFMAEHKPSPELADMFLAGAAARVEHYEIAAYNGLIEMAKGLGEDSSAKLLRENLAQEEHALETVESVGARMAKDARRLTAV
jgi:ferritin-like metal-binding protein YciE